MKKLIVLSATGLLLLLMSVSSFGFVNPPENFCVSQRHLLWNFDQESTWMVPQTIKGPVWDQGDWECDEVTTEHSVPTCPMWHESYSGWAGHTGLVGIINNTGGEVTGKITFHVNNYENDNWEKRFWDEAVYRFSPGCTFDVVAPPSYAVNWDTANEVLLPEGGLRDNVYGTINPNPSWEEFVWNFTVPDGEWALIDSFEVATLCIPEPGTIMLIGCALVAMAGVVRRKF